MTPRLELYHPDLKAAWATATAFCADWWRNDRATPLLVICGPSGNGKTQLMREIQKHMNANFFKAFEAGFWRNPTSPIWSSWDDALKCCENRALWGDLLNAPILLLDDAGTETDRFRSGEPVRALGELLGARACKFTVVTTNVTPEHWAAKFDVRVEDRLLRNSRIINLQNVPSYAKKKIGL